MLEESQAVTIAISLGFFFFILSIQDIAVDGWAVEILSQENSSYASFCQAAGHRIGGFIGSSFFIALNSTDFCN